MPDIDRSGRLSYEASDPQVRDRLLAITRAEVGGQGPLAQQAFLETIFNRAAARGQTLGQTLSGSYFPDVTYSRATRGVSEADHARYDPILANVLGGSNVANYATGNASGKVGFAGGPQTATYGGERYGVEGPDRSWAASVGYRGGTSLSEMAGMAPRGGTAVSLADLAAPRRREPIDFTMPRLQAAAPVAAPELIQIALGRENPSIFASALANSPVLDTMERLQASRNRAQGIR